MCAHALTRLHMPLRIRAFQTQKGQHWFFQYRPLSCGVCVALETAQEHISLADRRRRKTVPF